MFFRGAYEHLKENFFLQVFKEFVGLVRGTEEKWSSENFINLKSLKTVYGRAQSIYAAVKDLAVSSTVV